MNFLRVNVTFYDVVIIVYDVIFTCNLYPYTATVGFVDVTSKNDQQVRG